MKTTKPKSSGNSRAQLKLKRKKRIRKKITGTSERPRLSVFKTAKHVYCQVIDDSIGVTLVSASTFEKGGRMDSANVVACTQIGELIAKRCLEKSIDKIVFDKNGNQYHGRIKALAEGARSAGLCF